MKLLELHKIIFAALLAFAAVMMLPACSSTEESPPPEESGGQTLEECQAQCPAGDLQCQERCVQELPI